MRHIHPLPPIQVRGLSHRFPSRGSWVLRDISFHVSAGEWVVIMGANEAGKSTLLRILATLITPTRGRIYILGRDVMTHPSWVKGHLGVVLDGQRSFYYRLTALQNLEFFGGIYGLYGRALRHRVDEVLEHVGLRHARDMRFAHFSAGMRKRLALARALLADPPIYLLDEPIAHLDAEYAETLVNFLAELRSQGRTLLSTAHRPDPWGDHADRVFHLIQGRLQESV